MMFPAPFARRAASAAVFLALSAAPCGVARADGPLPAGDLFTIGRLHYGGGGDWYGDTTSLPNLMRALRERFGWQTAEHDVTVTPEDDALFNYPFLWMSGHGTVIFTDEDAARLRQYLEGGGFLWADDDYGMDASVRPAFRKLFPDDPMVEVPFDNEIYHKPYEFPHGLPKIHEHDGGPPKGYGVFHNGRLVIFYTFDTDIGDGMEDEEVHHDPAEKREAALKMGINVATYVLSH